MTKKDALRSVPLDTLVKGHGLTVGDATAIQSTALLDVFKKVVRKHSKNEAALADAWMALIAKTGAIGDKACSVIFDQITNIFQALLAGRMAPIRRPSLRV